MPKKYRGTIENTESDVKCKDTDYPISQGNEVFGISSLCNTAGKVHKKVIRREQAKNQKETKKLVQSCQRRQDAGEEIL